MKTKAKILTVLAFLALCSISLANELLVPSQHPTIQAAIDDCEDGDEVLVADGTYSWAYISGVIHRNKAIAVRSENGPENCIIDCEGETGFWFYRTGIVDCRLEGFTFINDAWDFGAIYCSERSSPTISNCIVKDNRGSAGIRCFSQSNPTISNCIITDNHCWSGGIQIYESSNPKIINCIISDNLNVGIYCEDSNPTIMNCTITDNWGGIHCISHRRDCRPTISNSILWANSPYEISLESGASASISYSDVQGGYEGEGNIDADPCFIEPGHWTDANDPNIIVEPNDPNAIWLDGDYHLLVASPCIEAGNPYFTYRPGDVDMDAQPRLMGRRVDMGADEFEIAMVVVTKPQGGEVWAAGSWHEIKWASYGISGTVDIYYSTNNGTDWVVIDNAPDSGSYMWHLPRTQTSWFYRKRPVDSNQCLVLVEPNTPVPNPICIESGLFTIQPYRRWPAKPWWPRCPRRKIGPKHGCVKWKFQTDGPVTAAVTIGCNNRVHIPCEDGKLYTLNDGGKLLWSYDTNSPLVSSPAVDRNGTVYVGAEDGKLYAIDRKGRLLWTHTTEGPIYSSPVVSPYCPLCHLKPGYPYPPWMAHFKHWHRMAARCRALKWLGRIYVCSVDGTLYALAHDGSELWSFETDGIDVATGAIFASPAISSYGNVYITGIYDPNLYALASSDGSVKWNRNFLDPCDPTGKRPWPFASPVVAKDGTIYQAMLYDPNLYAIGPNDGSIIWSTSLAGLVLRYGRDPDEYIIWYGVGDPPEYIEIDGRRYRVREVYPYLYASCWSKPALAPDGTIYVSFDDPYLRAIDPNGTIKWMAKLGELGGFTLTVGGDGLIYAACDDAHLYVVDPDGGQVAQFEGGGGLSFPTITVGRTIIVSDANNTVWAIGRHNCKGRVLDLHQLEDLNGDGTVNNIDFAVLTADWLNCTDTDPPCDYQGDQIYLKGDINKDQYVDFADFMQLANRWLSKE